MNKKKLPKVLIVNVAFNYNSGGGITLTNLFNGWDSDKIAVCCSSVRLAGELDTNICKNYYQLGSEEYRFIFPFSVLEKKKYSGLVEFNKKNVSSIEPSKTQKTSIRHKFIMNVLFPLLEYIGLIGKMTKFKLSRSFCNWLNEFKPDIIYAQANNVEDIELILSIRTYLQKPLIFT